MQTITPNRLRRIETLLAKHGTAEVAARCGVTQETVQLIARGEFQTRRDMSALASGDPSLLARCPGCGGKTLKHRLRPDCRHCETLAMFPLRAPCHEPAKITLRLEPEQQRRLVAIRKKIGLSGVC